MNDIEREQAVARMHELDRQIREAAEEGIDPERIHPLSVERRDLAGALDFDHEIRQLHG